MESENIGLGSTALHPCSRQGTASGRRGTSQSINHSFIHSTPKTICNEPQWRNGTGRYLCLTKVLWASIFSVYIFIFLMERHLCLCSYWVPTSRTRVRRPVWYLGGWIRPVYSQTETDRQANEPNKSKNGIFVLSDLRDKIGFSFSLDVRGQ